MSDPYDEHAAERWVREPAKRPGRTAFARDRGRVLHSAALRRLAGKTQVVVAGESDFPRTRLTHSLEVAQIGRELGQVLGCDPDVVEVACLAHDLGHPPFGHNGEQALDDVAQDCGGFEGNAQTLRVLTRLEAKTFGPSYGPRPERSVGLNLTRASLDAATKYPWPRSDGPKFGVYADDADVFAWLRDGAPGRRRCLEAQVMDWADDIAYCVHDVEDAVQAGHLQLAQLGAPAERAEVVSVAGARYAEGAPGADAAELDTALSGLQAEPFWPESFDGSIRALAALKNLTSQLIGRLARAAEDATREVYGPAPLARYGADLVVPRPARLECAVLKAVAGVYVMNRAGAQDEYARQRDLVRELAKAVLEAAPASLGPELAPEFEAATDDGARLRVVVDRVAGLTDSSAVEMLGRLS
ncbi:MAG TPA: deoxyguanosinetriphosphate triphosphohydrolase [Actinomycetes bacterium]